MRRRRRVRGYAVRVMSSGLDCECVNTGFPFVLISCTGGPSALFRFSSRVAPSSSLSTLQIKRALCLHGRLPENTHRFHVVLMRDSEADGITVIQAIGPFIKRQAVLIHLIAPGVWKRCHSSVDISSMRCLQAINVCFYKICLYYSVLISVLL